MKKITFIEPQVHFDGYSYFKLPLLGPLYLATILHNAGYEAKVYAETFGKIYDEKIDWILPEILESDVVGISLITATAPRGYKIAQVIKSFRPQLRVILGGSHVTALPDEALKYADQVVIGEGENVILDLIEDGKQKVVRGERLEILDLLPFPDLTLLEGAKIPPRVWPIMTSRGCPYNCKFCSVTAMFGRKLRCRSPEAVVEEISYAYNQGGRSFFFYDDNFGVHKKKAIETLEGIINKNLSGIGWSAQTRVETAKDAELVKLMSRVGCSRLLIGFESVNPRTLEFYNKGAQVEDTEIAVRTLHQYKVKVHGMFVLGSDEDDACTIEETVKFCQRLKIDSAQFSILFPIPGTRLFEDLDSQNRIFTKDWSLYDGLHVVFHPLRMTVSDLQSKVLDAYKRFYSFASGKTFLYSRYALAKWRRLNRDFLSFIKRFQTQPRLVGK